MTVPVGAILAAAKTEYARRVAATAYDYGDSDVTESYAVHVGIPYASRHRRPMSENLPPGAFHKRVTGRLGWGDDQDRIWTIVPLGTPEGPHFWHHVEGQPDVPKSPDHAAWLLGPRRMFNWSWSNWPDTIRDSLLQPLTDEELAWWQAHQNPDAPYPRDDQWDATGWGALADWFDEQGLTDRYEEPLSAAPRQWMRRILRGEGPKWPPAPPADQPSPEELFKQSQTRLNYPDQLSRYGRVDYAAPPEEINTFLTTGDFNATFDPNNYNDHVLADFLADHGDPREVIVRRDLGYRTGGRVSDFHDRIQHHLHQLVGDDPTTIGNGSTYAYSGFRFEIPHGRLHLTAHAPKGETIPRAFYVMWRHEHPESQVSYDAILTAEEIDHLLGHFGHHVNWNPNVGPVGQQLPDLPPDEQLSRYESGELTDAQTWRERDAIADWVSEDYPHPDQDFYPLPWQAPTRYATDPGARINLLNNPQSLMPLLVGADWSEEHDDPREAAFRRAAAAQLEGILGTPWTPPGTESRGYTDPVFVDRRHDFNWPSMPEQDRADPKAYLWTLSPRTMASAPLAGDWWWGSHNPKLVEWPEDENEISRLRDRYDTLRTRDLNPVERAYANIEPLGDANPETWANVVDLMRQRWDELGRLSRYARTDYGDRDALQAAVRANPWSIGAHQGLADWEQEYGDPDEAAFRAAVFNWLPTRLDTIPHTSTDMGGFVRGPYEDEPLDWRTVDRGSLTGRVLLPRHSRGIGPLTWQTDDWHDFAFPEQLADFLYVPHDVARDQEQMLADRPLFDSQHHWGSVLLPGEWLYLGGHIGEATDPRIWPQLEAILRERHRRGQRLSRYERTDYGAEDDLAAFHQAIRAEPASMIHRQAAADLLEEYFPHLVHRPTLDFLRTHPGAAWFTQGSDNRWYAGEHVPLEQLMAEHGPRPYPGAMGATGAEMVGTPIEHTYREGPHGQFFVGERPLTDDPYRMWRALFGVDIPITRDPNDLRPTHRPRLGIWDYDPTGSLGATAAYPDVVNQFFVPQAERRASYVVPWHPLYDKPTVDKENLSRYERDPTTYGDLDDYAAFLRAINQEPREVANHVVLADWIADHPEFFEHTITPHYPRATAQREEDFRRQSGAWVQRRMSEPWQELGYDDLGRGYRVNNPQWTLPALDVNHGIDDDSDNTYQGVVLEPGIQSFDSLRSEWVPWIWRGGRHTDDGVSLTEAIAGIGVNPFDIGDDEVTSMRSNMGHWMAPMGLGDRALAGIDDFRNIDPTIWPHVEGRMRDRFNLGLPL